MKIYENYNNWGMSYHKRYGYEPINMPEDKKKNSKMARLLRNLDKKAQMEYEFEHKNGYCPKCHCLLRLNGKCDNCD